MIGGNARYSPRESNGEYLDNVVKDNQNTTNPDNIVFNVGGKTSIYNLQNGFFGDEPEHENSKYIPAEVRLLKSNKYFKELVDEINK